LSKVLLFSIIDIIKGKLGLRRSNLC